MAETLWPWLPLEEIGETLSWETDLQPRRDDDIRATLRAVRQSLTLRHSLRTPDYVRLRDAVRATPLGDWLVPVWPDATRGVAVGAADTLLAVETDADYVAGGRAIVWAGCDAHAVVEVSAVGEGEISLAEATGTEFPDALVMPLRRCLVRDGYRVTKRDPRHWSVEATFEALDGPDPAGLGEPLSLIFALDASGTMPIEVADGITRWDVTVRNVGEILDWLEQSGLAHSVRIILWTDPDEAIERIDCDAADYQDLRDFLAGIASFPNGSGIERAFDDAAAFYAAGSGRRLMLFTADQSASNLAAAIALRDAIAGLTVRVVTVEDDFTFYDTLDSYGGHVTSTGPAIAMAEALQLEALSLAAHDGLAYLACAGAVVEPLGGLIRRAAVVLDGLGPATATATRAIDDDQIAATLVRSGRTGVRETRRQLGFLQGRHRPFWIPEFSLPILASTTGTVTVAAGVHDDVADWTDTDLALPGGVFRRVTGASVVGGDHELVVATMPAAPTGRVRILRRVRQLADRVEIGHRRRAGIARVALGLAAVLPETTKARVNVAAINRVVIVRVPQNAAQAASLSRVVIARVPQTAAQFAALARVAIIRSP